MICEFHVSLDSEKDKSHRSTLLRYCIENATSGGENIQIVPLIDLE